MTLAWWGALTAGAAASGLAVVVLRLSTLRRPQLRTRVLPYLRDLPQVGHDPASSRRAAERSALTAIFGPVLFSAARTLDRVLGGSTSVRRRLTRANLPLTVHDFRVEQALWGLTAFGVAAALSLAVSLREPQRGGALVIVCAVAFAVGVMLRENRLTAQVARRERRVLAEFPTVAELLALSVAAGEGPVPALERVVSRSRGELATDLSNVLAEVRTGTPVARALDDLATRTGVPAVARFAEGMAIAVERGTPLADVLHHQAADVREAGRRSLIEAGARKEIAMMVPVVFLVLPVTVIFAFWPGVVGLRLVAP
jgi:tight adherence protein C